RPPAKESADSWHVYNQFTIRCKERDALREFLSTHGIPTEIYYPLPLHLQPAFSYLAYQLGDLPVSETASREALSIPLYPELNEERQAAAIDNVAAFYRAQTE